MEKVVKGIKESFRNGDMDSRMSFLKGSYETFEQWMLDYFELGEYYDVDSEVFSYEEVKKNSKMLNDVIFEECVERLRLELNL
jgi:hypothetical protein